MSVIEQNAEMIIPVTQKGETWCIYEHFIGTEKTVIYLHCCKLNEVFRLHGARANSEWAEMFKGGGHVGLRIIATGDDHHEMLKLAQRKLKEYPTMPVCNLRGFNRHGAYRRVRCIETGIEFDTQMDAAVSMGLPQSSISRHLRGSLNMVRGFHFELVADK